MSLKQQLLNDIKEAMKSKDSTRLNTLRLINSEIKNKEIDRKIELSDEDILSLFTTQIKKRKEAIALYEKGGREDLKEKESSELEILKAYLPEQVSEEALASRIKEVISELQAEGPKDMGKVMKTVVPEFKGRADGNAIKRIVSELLKGS